MTPNEAKDLLYKAAGIKKKIAELDFEYSLVEQQVEDAIRALASDEKLSVVVGDIGTYSISSKKSWTYSEGLQEMKASIKDLEKVQEQDGTATYTEKFYPRFVISKE